MNFFVKFQETGVCSARFFINKKFYYGSEEGKSSCNPFDIFLNIVQKFLIFESF